MATNRNNYRRRITPAQCKDSGMALVLVFLIIAYFSGEAWPVHMATGVLILNMIWPGIFRPFAWFWYGLAEVLGIVSSNVILTLVFILIVSPVGLLRRALGKDRLMLKAFKKRSSSVLITRNHQFTKKDIEKPF